MHSIRSRTMFLVLGLLGVSLAVISWLSYRDARHEIEELFDAQLARSARLLEGMVSRDMPPSALASLQQTLDQAIGRHDGASPGHPYEGKLAFQVVDGNAEVILQSASAPPELVERLRATRPAGDSRADGMPGLHDQSPGYREVAVGEHRWRVFVLQDVPDGYWIVVGERDDVRGELVEKIALRSLIPDLIGLPLLALLVWLAIGWSLAPLKRMAELIRTRDPDKLAPLELAGLPRELEPMVTALNRLLQQLNSLLEREKRFLADAAHELRTPLAVLRIHAQNALDAPDPADRTEALRQMLQGVDRATRLVAQLLTLARLEPNAAQLELQEVDLQSLIRNELAELTPLALEREQDLMLNADDTGDYRLQADSTSLGVLLQNLVGNAIQYTPPHGRIQVRLRDAQDSIELEVHDSGPGVAAAMRDKLFERFFREGGGSGAGLGLSIVQRIVELHRGKITLIDSPLGGLVVRVSLPRQRTG
jgi:two-component system, OmpR family, sensor histidine kinase QseC